MGTDVVRGAPALASKVSDSRQNITEGLYNVFKTLGEEVSSRCCGGLLGLLSLWSSSFTLRADLYVSFMKTVLVLEISLVCGFGL